jgi:hypothetical protein
MLAENRTSKYMLYAIGEIVLVVIGILIALQINTWNQERINAREEERIFQDLAEELEYNYFLIEHGKNTMTEVVSASKRMLAKINNEVLTFSEDSFNRDLAKLTMVWVSGRPTTLYDVLSASGDFKLISNPILRKKLADLKRNQESLIRFEDIQYRFVDEQLRPFLNKNFDRTKIRVRFKSADQVATEHYSAFEPNTEELIYNREFANLLTDLIFFSDRIKTNYQRIEDDNYQIDSLIKVKFPDLATKNYIPY